MSKIFKFLSFNKRYYVASVIYLGITLLLIGILPNIVSLAQNSVVTFECSYEKEINIEGTIHTETVSGCPDGQTCCEATGECITVE
jgi:hypothetical protein